MEKYFPICTPLTGLTPLVHKTAYYHILVKTKTDLIAEITIAIKNDLQREIQNEVKRNIEVLREELKQQIIREIVAKQIDFLQTDPIQLGSPREDYFDTRSTKSTQSLEWQEL